MNNMADGPTQFDRPAWQTAVNWVSAILVAALFISSGVWKITSMTGWAVRLHQLLVPENVTLPFTFALGIAETLAGILVLFPRFRRWGAWLSAILLVAFMIYVGIFYRQLTGADCSCFPWMKRAINPMFFVEDLGMLLLAVLAGIWARRSESLRSAVVILGAITVFAAISLGVELTAHKGTLAPPTITVDGKPFNLRDGKVYIFYFDPECLHCLDAAKKMSKMNWGDTKIVVVPVRVPQFAHDFLHDASLQAGVSNDLELLKKTFPFVSAPAAVALEDGREKAAIAQFGDIEPEPTLRKLKFIN